MRSGVTIDRDGLLGVYRYAETPDEKLALIAEVFAAAGSGGQAADASRTALLMLAERRHTGETRDGWPDNYLQVAMNPETGYGGLIWWVGPARAAASQDEDDEDAG